ncbi:type II secretion system GspH family protein [bacterium]|nr:type II secretion system GspH family protein [bacterium]
MSRSKFYSVQKQGLLEKTFKRKSRRSQKKAFTILELSVVMTIMTIVIGTAFLKSRNDGLQSRRQASKVDKQQAIRRFLMWFRNDMLSLDQINDFRTRSSGDPNLDQQLVYLKFDHFVGEFEKRNISYFFDPLKAQMIREVTNPGTPEEKASVQRIKNIYSIQMIPIDFNEEKIRNPLDLINLYFFDVRVVFSEINDKNQASNFHQYKLKVFPRLKSSYNKSNFNRFNLSGRFQ